MPHGCMCDNCAQFFDVERAIGLLVPEEMTPLLEPERFDPTFCSLACLSRWAAKKASGLHQVA